MTDILIGSHSRNNWQRPGTTATLRIWFSGEFRDSNGVIIDPGNGTSSFYKIVPCTVNSTTHVITVPAFTLPSTLDGFPSSVQSFGRLYDASSAAREFIWSGWSLSNLPTSLPFDSWFVFNQGSSLSTLSNSLQNRMWVSALVDSLLGLASQGIVSEIPTGTPNGILTTFTLSQTPIVGSVELFQNKQLQQEGVDYTISANVITFTVPPSSGDWLFAAYRTTATLLTSPSLASASNIGSTSLSLNAANPAIPIAVGDNDPRIPTQAENDALAGTVGAPSSTNKYITSVDPRVSTGVWKHRGTVLQSSLAIDNGNVFEPSIIYEGSPQVLTGYTNVFKMWFDSGWGAGAGVIGYAESPDGINWTRQTAPLFTDHYRTSVMKNGSTYYLFAANIAATQIDVYTSSNGVTWTLGAAAIITAAGGPTEIAIHNSSVYVESGTWYMLYDQQNAAGFTTGLATATNPVGTWTKQGTVMSFLSGTGTLGGASPIAKVGSTYYVWIIRAVAAGVLPTDIWRYSASAIAGPWTSSATVSIPRVTIDEGADTAIGQTADPSWVEANGKVYMYYSASPDGVNPEGFMHIKLAIADMPMSRLVGAEDTLDQASVGSQPGGLIFYQATGLPYPRFSPVAFENSWVDYTPTADVNPTGFYKDKDGVVHLRGAAKSGTVGQRIFRLPLGMRPFKLLVFNVISNAAVGQLNIEADGTVALASGSNVFLSFEGITFFAET
jgi:hypothetical protein